MNKKIKRFAITTIICVLVASIFGTVMVLAPAPPDWVFPELMDVFVTNTSDDPVPVDVSGWLHTVSTGRLVLDMDIEPDEHHSFHIVTEGYRLINLIISREADTTWDGRAIVWHFLQTWGTLVDAIDFESPQPVTSGFLTYEITMNEITIDFRNVGAETIPAGEVVVDYYMTT